MRRTRRTTEASVAYRASVLVTVLVGIVAVTAERGITPTVGAFGLVLVPAGFAISYVRRDARNTALKAALAISLFVAFGDFLRTVRFVGSIDEARTPLAALFVWVQVLHSFDVPRRRDLNFSFGASVALMAMAGALSISTAFGLALALWIPAAAASLALGHLSDLRERAGAGAAVEVPDRRAPGRATAQDRRAGLVKPAAFVLALALAASAAMFLALPRLPGMQLTSLPFEIVRRNPIPGFDGQVFNPGLAAAGGTSAEGGFSPDAYFGYGDSLDLRVRGRLSEDLVMRVRSPEGAFWRAQIYDRFDGTRWTSTDTEPDRVTSSFGLPIPIRSDGRPSHEVTQTFFVERELPNLVFHAFEPHEVMVSGGEAFVDDFGSIRLPYTLEKDTIYSVVSRVPDVTDEELSSLSDLGVPAAFDRYLQLPDRLPKRVRDLSAQITAGLPNVQAKAVAVQDWLRTNTVYDLDIPRDPRGADAVDHFLFVRRRGFCEHIATAMTVLLRAAGVPARLATGFTPGERNPFTGFWEVRNSDAHSWVEVYHPGAGWIEYDPTHEVPDAGPSGEMFVAKPLFATIGRVIPQPVLRAAGRVFGAAADVARAAPAVPLGTAAAVIAALALLRRKRAAASRQPAAVEAWLRTERALAAHGIERRAETTVREFASDATRRAPPGLDAPALRELADVFARVRYGPGPPLDADLERIGRLADRVGASLK